MARIPIAFQRIVPDWSFGELLNPNRISGIRIIPNWTVAP